MKQHLLFVLAVACTLGTANLVCGQGGPPPRRAVLEVLDKNGDGTISAEEIQSASASLLQLDRNGDGMLTSDELLPQVAPDVKAAGDMVQRLMALDQNGDGVLTADEIPPRMQPLFQRGDANHDGKLTGDEIKGMAQAQTALRGRPVGRNGAEGMLRMDPLINVLDIDHDGTLSAAEIASAPGALKALDTNADGMLQPAEIRVRQQTPAERAAHVLDEWDTNKDGVLTQAESPDRMQQQFEAIDTNHDGRLNAEELSTYFATQPQTRRGDLPRNDAPSAKPLPGATGQTAAPAQPQ